MCKIWITAVVLTGRKNYFCKLRIVSSITKYEVSATSLLIARMLLPIVDPRTELKFGNLSYFG